MYFFYHSLSEYGRSSSADRANRVFGILAFEDCEGDMLPRVHGPASLRHEFPLLVSDNERGSGQPEGGATSAPAPEHGAGMLRQPLILQKAPANEQRARR
jgi:hypothetical protein